MYVPASVKRPHWVQLGFQRALAGPGVRSHVVLGRRLVSFTTPSGELQVAADACPHRGASLALGVARGECVECPYHGLSVSLASHPERFHEYASLQGLVWLDVARELVTQHFMPPYFPELTSGAWATEDDSHDLPVNAVVLMEHLLDGFAAAQVERDGPHGLATRTLPTHSGPLTVRVEYHVPLAAGVRFSLAGAAAWAVVGLQPVSRRQTRVHVRTALSCAPGEASAAVNAAAREVARSLQTGEDVDVLRGVDLARWGRGRPDECDGLVGAFREGMRALYPDMLAYLVGDDARVT